MRHWAARTWDAWCGVVYGAAVLADPDFWNRHIPGWFQGAAGDCLSDRLSVVHDPIAGNRVLPVDLTSSIVCFAIGCEWSGRGGHSHRARGKSAHSAELHAECGRSMQRNPLSAFIVGGSCGLRVLGRAEYMETGGAGCP